MVVGCDTKASSVTVAMATHYKQHQVRGGSGNTELTTIDKVRPAESAREANQSYSLSLVDTVLSINIR